MKATVKRTEQDIKGWFNDLSDNEQVNIHNEFCQENNLGDDEIFNNDEDFFNTFFDGKVIEAVRAVSFGEYNYSDEYVKFNGYGNLESFNSPADHIDTPQIIQAILDDEFTPYCLDIEEPEEEEED